MSNKVIILIGDNNTLIPKPWCRTYSTDVARSLEYAKRNLFSLSSPPWWSISEPLPQSGQWCLWCQTKTKLLHTFSYDWSLWLYLSRMIYPEWCMPKKIRLVCDRRNRFLFCLKTLILLIATICIWTLVKWNRQLLFNSYIVSFHGGVWNDTEFYSNE